MFIDLHLLVEIFSFFVFFSFCFMGYESVGYVKFMSCLYTADVLIALSFLGKLIALSLRQVTSCCSFIDIV